MKYQYTTALAAIGLLLCGCASAVVTPTRMSQPGDESLDCAVLQQAIDKNEALAADFIKRDRKVEDSNTAKGIGGAIPYLGILVIASTDLSNKEQIEARALVDSNERLSYLYKQKNCKKQGE